MKALKRILGIAMLLIGLTAIFPKISIAQTNIVEANTDLYYNFEVNTYNGNLFYTRRDLYLPSVGNGIDFNFAYNSEKSNEDSGYGLGWTMQGNIFYTEDANGDITIERSDGRKDTFTFSGGNYQSPVGNFETLTKSGTTVTLTNKYGKVTEFADASHKKVTKITDRNGNSLTFSYTGGYLTNLSDNYGRQINLTWQSGHLATVTDNSIPASPRTWTYQYTGNHLTKVIKPIAGIECDYGYNGNNKMSSFTDENGNQLTFDYYPNGAFEEVFLLSGNHNFNKKITYDVSNLNAIQSVCHEWVDDAFQTTTYIHNNQKQLIEKIGNCCGYHTEYVYDGNNNIVEMIDANDHSTHYTYDSNGNVLTETDALGNSMSYTYESTFNQVLTMTDKNGNVTSYTYDANGNISQINRPLSVSESYTYNADGTPITYTDGEGNTTTYSYDTWGNLYQTTDVLNNVSTTNYDLRGNLTSETDANNCTTTYTYDALDRRINTNDPLNNARSYTYDDADNRITVTDENGNTSTSTYDELYRVTAIAEPLSITTTYMYDEKNRIAMTDPNGNTTQYSYNTQNLVAEITDTEGITNSFTYDTKGNRLSATDGNGNTTYYEYDDIDQLTKITDALSGEMTYEYDPNGNQIKVTDENGNETDFAYDALDRRTQITNALNGVTTFTFDANSNQTKVTDANGNDTDYTYDALDRLTLITNALNGTIAYTYDNIGNQLTMTDANGNTTTNTYDCLNRVLTTTNAENETTSFTFDPNGNQTQVAYPNGNTVIYTYDAVNRATAINDNIGLVMTYTYDLNSNVLTQTDGNNNTVSLVYDNINRLIEQIDTEGESTLFEYDENSNLLLQTDRNGNDTEFDYDELNRRIQMTDALSNTTVSAYDAVSNLISITDENDNTTSYTYDALYRNTAEIFDDNTSKNYTYDAVGNMLTRNDNNGNTTNYTYDDLYRLTGRDYPDINDDAFSYDVGGRMLSANNHHAAVSYVYDDANRTLSETLNGQITAYNYDIPNNKRTLSYPGGRVITEDYDQRSRLNIIQEGASNLANFTYDLGNRITQKSYANGTNTNLTYNDNNWLTRLTHNNGSNFADFEYDHDAEGNKLYAQHNHKTDHSEQYDYDNIYRLTTYKKGTLATDNIPTPSTQTQYNMDALGNRTTTDTDGNVTTYTANNMNEYTQLTGVLNFSPTYNANGNTTFDGTNPYTYDYENRLKQTAANSYQYDALGRRTQKNVSGTVTNFFYDGARVIEEQNHLNTTQATYIYGTWIDDILSMTRSGSTYYYHHNALGSVIALTSATGTVTERYEYDAYGLPTFYDANYNTLTGSTANNPYLFTARRWDTETQLYYYRARHYHPILGRFMQRDPIGYVDGMSLYEYVGGNGVNWVDPWGLFITKIISELIEKIETYQQKPGRDCIGCVVEGLKHLRKDGSNEIDKTVSQLKRNNRYNLLNLMKSLKKKGICAEVKEYHFLGEGKKPIPKGTAVRPTHHQDKTFAEILLELHKNSGKEHSVFTIGLCDCYHCVTVIVNKDKFKTYDQHTSDEYTLDEFNKKILELTQGYFDPKEDTKKPKSRIWYSRIQE